MINSGSLKNRVMARIYFEYAKSLVVQYPDYIMFLLFTAVSFSFVSFRNVLENIPKDSLMSAFNFFVIAVKNTRWVIQALMAGFLVRMSMAGTMAAYRSLKNANFLERFSRPRLVKYPKNSSL